MRYRRQTAPEREYREPGILSQMMMPILVLLLGAAGSVAYKFGPDILWGGKAKEVAEITSDQADWRTQRFGEMSLEAPFYIGLGPDLSQSIPEQFRKDIESIESYESKDETSDMKVIMMRVAVKAGVPLDLDQNIRALMTTAVRKAGMSGLGVNIMPASVKGAEARRARYESVLRGRTVYLDTVCAVKGNVFWTIQTVHGQRSLAAVVDRIMESIAIK